MSSKRPIPITDLINLDQKRAIVTGGAAGIGFAISQRLAEAGATVFIADKDPEGVQEAARRIGDGGYRAHFAQCDVSREEAVQGMVSAAVEKMGGVDILVNNAGIYLSIPLSQTSGDDFARMVAVNLRGTFLSSRAASQRMIEQGRGGCIINVASIDAVHPSGKGLSAYDASKGGVLMLTRSMALELGQHNIRVNAIAPGGVLTEGALAQGADVSPREMRAQLKRFMARIPLGRMGNADDIARVVLFLASNLAGYMTGSFVVVDGGYLVS